MPMMPRMQMAGGGGMMPGGMMAPGGMGMMPPMQMWTPAQMQQMFAMMQAQQAQMGAMGGMPAMPAMPMMMPQFGMPPMQQQQTPQQQTPQQQPGQSPPGQAAAAAAAAAVAAQPQPAPIAVPQPSPVAAQAPGIRTPSASPSASGPVAGAPNLPMMPAMPMMPNLMMMNPAAAMMMNPAMMAQMQMPAFGQQPPVQQQQPSWVISQAAPVVAAAPAPVVAPPKADVFGDLSNPSLALKTERFRIEQSAKPTAPPPSAGVRAQDDAEEEEDFADFASAGQDKDAHRAEDFSFDAPVSAVPSVAAPAPTLSPSISVPAPSPAVGYVDLTPAPTAEALMNSSFDIFAHKQNAPLVSHPSMAEFASAHPRQQQPQQAQAAAAAAVRPGKARRDIPDDLDALMDSMVGGHSTETAVELPALGAPLPAASKTTAAVEEDDEGFGDFTSTAASGALAPQLSSFAMPPQQQPLQPAATAAVEDDDEEFADFATAAAPAATIAVPKLPVSSPMPPSDHAPVVIDDDEEGDEDEEEEEDFGDFGRAEDAHPHTIPQAALPKPQVEEEEEDFADFSSSTTAAPAAAPVAKDFDYFASLSTDGPTTDAALSSMSPQPLSLPVPATTAAVADEGTEDEDEEDFADFSSAPAASSSDAHPAASADAASLSDSGVPLFSVTAAPVLSAEEQQAAALAAAKAAEPEQPKSESDLVGAWATQAPVRKKENPFAVATQQDSAAAAPAEPAPVPSSSPPAAAPSFDDVFGSLLGDADSSPAPAPALLDLMPAPVSAPASKPKASLGALLGASSSSSSASRGSVSTDPNAFLFPVAAAPVAAPAATKGDESEEEEGEDDDDEDDDEGGFGSFASSGTGPVAAPTAKGAAFTAPFMSPSPPLTLSTTPAPLVAPAAPAYVFALSAEAEAMTLPPPLVVSSIVPPDFPLAPRADPDAAAEDGAAAPMSLPEAYSMLVREERFAEARACHAQLGVAAQLAEVSSAYKAALLAAEEDEEQLATAMALQKRLKELKASKPLDRWMRPFVTLSSEDQSALSLTAPSWSQLLRSLRALDPEWDAFFTSLYPSSFGALALASGAGAEEAGLAGAAAAQQEAKALVDSVLGPVIAEKNARASAAADGSSSSSSTGAASLLSRCTTVLDYILSTLSTGAAFVRSVSELDLTDPSKSAAFSASLCSERSRSFLSGCTALYRILLRLEFGCALFGVGIDAELFGRGHAHWLSVTQHLASAPLSTFLGEWIAQTGLLVDVAAFRADLQRRNSVEEICAQRGRHSCTLCLTNTQMQDGSDNAQQSRQNQATKLRSGQRGSLFVFVCVVVCSMCPECVALQARLFPSSV